MLSRNRLSYTCKAAAGVALLLITFTACKHSEPVKPPPSTKGPTVKYNQTYDAEIKEITDLASKGRWEEAQLKVTALHEEAKDNPLVTRVYNWVEQESQKVREQALENKLREIDAKNSVFNPTLLSLAQEQKDRGLPPRKDIRDTVAKIGLVSP